ncbi:MAG: hypothetical protein KJ983_02710 [Candidatus Omnitrophica bacterium]|nr:hypothetical protein [Candidatus Omnitrophota bacterium]
MGYNVLEFFIVKGEQKVPETGPNLSLETGDFRIISLILTSEVYCDTLIGVKGDTL